ncbi:hypothetical protein A3461_23500 [Enterobacter roggenkampii]|nr:hypothetical protein A3461_23500 [Enterobacter roggenkampii]
MEIGARVTAVVRSFLFHLVAEAQRQLMLLQQEQIWVLKRQLLGMWGLEQVKYPTWVHSSFQQ